MKRDNKSIEELIEDKAKRQLEMYGVRMFSKTQSVNSQIDDALKKAPSKRGGKGNNYPDIKVLITTEKGRCIPVMIEVKGKKGDLKDASGNVENRKPDGSFNFKNIAKYAVNGAVHYSEAIITHSESYDEAIAIGINGYKEGNDIIIEIGTYYLSKKQLLVPKLIRDYSDLSFLKESNLNELIDVIDNIELTEEERETKTQQLEDNIESNLISLNQEMRDVHEISEDYRVKLIAGLIMAGLGVKNKVQPLSISSLLGDTGSDTHDGCIVMNKIRSFLKEKNLPEEKRDMICNVLSSIFLHAKSLSEPENGETKIKKIYKHVKDDILPYYDSRYQIDFTGRLFNTLNAWVKVPDGNLNDVVLTPRYVCELMAKICKVDMNSFVWDYTTGSAGFLISAMKLMIDDAKNKYKGEPEKRETKITEIKANQLLGIEKLPDIYILAVLNMILMEDGSANILNKNSLTDYDGNYEQGNNIGKPFPANVFLLNPPYSEKGKGFIFVEKALKRMSTGRAAILIQENSGSGKGLPYTKKILERNKLIASIHMPDIFKGKSNVQTAIYLFEVGVKHSVEDNVIFIDFSEDGYTRTNRRKSSQRINLRDTNNARERYQEIVDIILDKKKKTHFYDELTIKDTINLEGKDWTYKQHVDIDTNTTDEDFCDTVNRFVEWQMMKMPNQSSNFDLSHLIQLKEKFKKEGGIFKSISLNTLFDIKANPQLDKCNFNFSENAEYPYFTRTEKNNGICGYVEYLDEDHKIKGNSLAIGMIAMKFFYMEHDFYAGQFTKTAFPKFEGFDKTTALYFIALLNKHQDIFKRVIVGDFEETFNKTKIVVPYKQDKIAFDFIKDYIKEVQVTRIKKLTNDYNSNLEKMLNVCNLKLEDII